jgi:hypothetical protein
VPKRAKAARTRRRDNESLTLAKSQAHRCCTTDRVRNSFLKSTIGDPALGCRARYLGHAHQVDLTDQVTRSGRGLQDAEDPAHCFPFAVVAVDGIRWRAGPVTT